MAIIWRNAGGSIESTPVNLNKALKQLERAIKAGAKKGAELSLYAVREQIQRGLQSNSLGLNPISASTRATRLAGKSDGIWPPRNRLTGTNPLWATGTTARKIQIKMHNDVFIMGFDEGVNFTYNKYSVGLAAKKQEEGYTIRGTYTRRMLAYLHILFKKRGPVGRLVSSRGGIRVGAEYSRRVDPRPAWSIVWARMQPTVLNTVAYHIVKQIKQTGLVVEVE